MIRALFILALALMPEAVFAQATNTPPRPERITKVIRVHYGEPQKFAEIVSHNAPLTADWDNTLKAVILKGSLADIATAEQTIKELDVPPVLSTANDVELVVYVIAGSNEYVPAVSPVNSLANVEPVMKQLRTIFPYKDYRLVGTALTRSQPGTHAQNNGLMNFGFAAAEQPSPHSSYSLSYDAANVSSKGNKTTIHLENFKFSATIWIGPGGDSKNPVQYQPLNFGVKSNVDLNEGQKVAVGKSDIAIKDSAIFIVLTAKLVD